jgi:4-hydroxy-tetrahydrodipicolinate synthase
MNFDGLWVPQLTAFDSAGNVDFKKVAEFAEILIANGANGIVAVGTTGENYALTLDERKQVVETIVKAAAGRVSVIAGVGGMSTNEAIGQAKLAKDAGAQGLMVAAPAYSLPTPEELIVHTKAVVNSVDLPTCLYDYPARTGTPFNEDSLDGLVGQPNIIGIKEASGDLDRIERFTARYGSKLQLVCGADADSAPFLSRAGEHSKSWIGGMGNILPKAHLGILDPATRDEAYSAVHPILSYVEEGRYIAKVKLAVALLGADQGGLRGPMSNGTAEERTKLEGLIAQAGEWAPQLV